ncbi:hypothetical protein ZIOFF_063777 [Zingiber officinale]|uniref:Uncharacterized protein n=1 Tax=Zingiber officinale TaxID=94328 RepID=A0A8J5KHN9_ZINOF|nr:hypothetical protein ZIOFF_063777 [Zingiber officinale]
MEPSAPHQFNIFQAFSAYSDIMSKAHLSGAKERLAILSRSLDSSGPTRINKSNDCSSKDSTSADTNQQPCISNTFSGLNLHPGSKRKSKYLEVSEMSDNLARFKRLKQTSFNNNLGHLESDSSVSLIGGTSGNQDGMNKHTTHNCLHTSPCAVEDSLFKGSTRSIPSGCCFNFDPKARIYT